MEKLIINNFPISELGAILAPDSYKSVLQWAKFKTIQTNDWAEYNYIEPDVEKPTLDKRQVVLNFHAKGENGYHSFITYLLQYVYSFYEFPELGIRLRMRVDTSSLQNIGGSWQSFSITFFDDAPYLHTPPSLISTNNVTNCSIDGYDLGLFGISVLQGTNITVLQKPQVKERLTISEPSINGAYYDDKGEIMFKSSTFTMKCLLRAPTLTAAVGNFYYLFDIVKQSGLRRVHAMPGGIFIINENLRVKMPAENIDCYYNQCTVNAVHNKLSSGLAGIAFDMSFNIVKRGIVTALGNDAQTAALVSDGYEYLLQGEKENNIKATTN